MKFSYTILSHRKMEADSSWWFTPLESPGIYAGDAINRKHRLLMEGGVKAPTR
jgi:hypothetical protein